MFAAETGFRLARNPDTVVGADVAFVPRVAYHRLASEGYREGAPDLAVETVSPGDTLEEVEEKVDAYLASGARAVLVLNPRRKTVTSHRPGQNPLVQHAGDVVELDDVVPGFSCEVAAIFA